MICNFAGCLHGEPFAEPGFLTNEAPGMELAAELDYERMLIEQSRARLHLIQADLAALRLCHLEMGDDD